MFCSSCPALILPSHVGRCATAVQLIHDAAITVASRRRVRYFADDLEQRVSVRIVERGVPQPTPLLNQFTSWTLGDEMSRPGMPWHPLGLGADPIEDREIAASVDERSERDALLAGLLAGLPEHQRVVVEMRYGIGQPELTVRDIAITLNESVAKVTRDLGKAMQVLRENA